MTLPMIGLFAETARKLVIGLIIDDVRTRLVVAFPAGHGMIDCTILPDDVYAVLSRGQLDSSWLYLFLNLYNMITCYELITKLITRSLKAWNTHWLIKRLKQDLLL